LETKEEKLVKKRSKVKTIAAVVLAVVIVIAVLLIISDSPPSGHIDVDFIDGDAELTGDGFVELWCTVRNFGTREAYVMITLYTEWDLGGYDSATECVILKPDESYTMYATLKANPLRGGETTVGKSYDSTTYKPDNWIDSTPKPEPTSTPTPTPKPAKEYETYSKYGFSFTHFQYSTGMEITEEGVDDAFANEDSGLVKVEYREYPEWESIWVMWFPRSSEPSRDFLINAIETTIAGRDPFVPTGGILETTISGHNVIMQKTIYNDETFPVYGVVAVWYCDVSSRMFIVIYDQSDESGFANDYMQYLEWFVCH
jgi:hypothetical protein